jgi:hypothetical protein
MVGRREQRKENNNAIGRNGDRVEGSSEKIISISQAAIQSLQENHPHPRR